MGPSGTKWLYAATVFAGSSLLFLIQPLIAKQILPWFGGTAAVWTLCMAFFQVLLLLGYAYSDWLSRNLAPRLQVTAHLVFLALSLSVLPIAADPRWKPLGGEDPMLGVLALLAATVGLPYFLLSTTGPLMQAWVARSHVPAQVYRYFSLSNLGSLLALAGYPFLIEPAATLDSQTRAWSAFYTLFTLLCAGSAVYFLRHAREPYSEPRVPASPPEPSPSQRELLPWIALSALGSWLLLATSNHITQNVATIPFLWLLPLTLYLLTFVLCFERDGWYRRGFFLPASAALLLLCSYGLQDPVIGLEVKTAVPLYALAMFSLCMVLHGELSRLRPDPGQLTRFYLMIALGGALGGMGVGILAPWVLPAYYELGIGYTLAALLLAAALRHRIALAFGATAVAACCGWFLYLQIDRDSSAAIRVERNFYGSIRVVDDHRSNPSDDVRVLYHGPIRHGEQFLAAERRREPTAYYGPSSGIARAITALDNPRRIGVVGLGAGTLALYGEPGDNYRFYEINPQVIRTARQEFSFLEESRARVEIVLGDARLALEREPSQGFDILAVDAFAGGSIPIHLITAEAIDVYVRHLSEEGLIAFNVTNRFLRLAAVVERIAAAEGLYTLFIHDLPAGTTLRHSDWVLMARNPTALAAEPLLASAGTIRPLPGLGVWTDDFHNLFEILK